MSCRDCASIAAGEKEDRGHSPRLQLRESPSTNLAQLMGRCDAERPCNFPLDAPRICAISLISLGFGQLLINTFRQKKCPLKLRVSGDKSGLKVDIKRDFNA